MCANVYVGELIRFYSLFTRTNISCKVMKLYGAAKAEIKVCIVQNVYSSP